MWLSSTRRSPGLGRAERRGDGGDFPRPRPDVDPERAVRQHAAPFFIALARCFQSREANPNGARLLFTDHNSYLLSRGILGRGQVWLAEKDGGATRLYPLTDYEPRKGEALEQGHLAGRWQVRRRARGAERLPAQAGQVAWGHAVR